MKKTELESRQDKKKIKKGLVHAIKHLNRSFRKQELRKKGITNERIQEISTTVFRLKGPTEYADQYIKHTYTKIHYQECQNTRAEEEEILQPSRRK